MTSPWRDIVETPENRFALKLLQRLTRRVDLPLALVHGPTGTGKTAMVNALVRRVIAGAGARTVQLVSAKELGFQNNGEIELRDLIAADLLIIEDLQMLTANAFAEFELILDKRKRLNRTTVITANAAPAKLRKLPARLLSRVISGVVAEITPYSAASRRAILQSMLKDLAIDADAVEWIVTQSNGGSARPLKGAVESLKAIRGGQATPISLAQAKSVMLEDAPGVERIIRRVAEAFGIKTRELLGPSRLKTVLLPRQVAMFLARDLAAMSLPQIGERFGGRDHSTVLHSVNKIREAMAGDRELAGTIRQLKLELA